MNASQAKLIFLVGMLVLLNHPFQELMARETDNIHEKPELIDPDNHRLYFRFVSGVARGQIPEKRMETTDSLLLAQNRIYQLTPLTSGDLDLGQYEIEYRFKDRFRIFAENRTVKEGGDFAELLKFREYQKRAGFGYFHPIQKFLSLGISLRDANIKQDFKSEYGNFYSADNSLLITFPTIESQLRTKGWVPGIHMEIKPSRWFEIHLSRLYYNMGGDVSRTALNLIPSSQALFYAPFYIQSDFLYNGVQDQFDVVFRYSSWFATKWGYTRDRMNIKFNQYYFSSLDNQTTLLMSALGRRTSTKLDFDSLNLTIEFSKSFGQDAF